MALETYEWERPLLTMAYEPISAYSHNSEAPVYQKELLERAYAHCHAITTRHSRSFTLASALLPWHKRRAVRALYAFCRTTDDIVDHPTSDAPDVLCDWWGQSLSVDTSPTDLVAIAWSDTRLAYQIPKRYAEQLILGVAQDLHKTRYNTFAELTNYCYSVASTVGLMSMHIIGFSDESAIRYAVKLGVALQLTNILRDVAEDWQRKRIYLPKEELEAFKLSETDLANGLVTDRWRKFMHFQIERARRLYREAHPGIVLLSAEGRLAIAAAADFYCAILDDIEAHDYDVFSRRSYVGTWGKLRRLPGLWWQTR